MGPHAQTNKMKIGFLSFGCPKNLVDGEVMLGMARDAGHEITNDLGRRRRARREHLRVHRHRQGGVDRRHPRDGGAQARRPLLAPHRHRLPRRALSRRTAAGRFPRSTPCSGPGKCRRFWTRSGTGALGRLGERSAGRQSFDVALQASLPLPHYRALRARRAAEPEPAPPDYIYDADTPRLLTTPKHFAYMKIAEGCDYTCAFCIIPTLRGGYRSRTHESIVREARALAERGVRELLLISQDTTLFRHRPWRTRRAGAAAARAERDRRARSGSGCSTSTRRRSPTTCWTRWRSARRCAAMWICRCSTRRQPS